MPATPPTLELLRFRASLLYKLTPVTERDCYFALVFTDRHCLDGNRLVFSGPGLSLVAALGQYGYSAAIHSALDVQVMRQQEQDLLADLALLNAQLEQEGAPARYALTLGQIVPSFQRGRVIPGPLAHDDAPHAFHDFPDLPDLPDLQSVDPPPLPTAQ